MIIGYTRVSSISQNLERHLKILKKFGVEKNIYRKTVWEIN
ncbi:DNA invertase Pin-like site-specific DNA recombinase [Staphylococcus capitis]|jgi:resolvase, N terminal domain|nr:DNA invertase [Staphylococcus capitis]OFR00588.1 DNA invertase [Staphylococcus sp. HMSC066C03]VTR12722.1 recombinase [Staphylococcus capitis]